MWARLRRAMRLVLVNSVAMAYPVPMGARLRVLRLVGYDIGQCHLMGRSIIRCTALRIGDDSFVNHHCFFDKGDLTLGKAVFVSSGVTFAMGDHEPGPAAKRAGADTSAPIVVGDGCWLGANTVILQGVTIAAGCVIGAGAVVTRSTEADGVYVGVPARRVRTLGPDTGEPGGPRWSTSGSV